MGMNLEYIQYDITIAESTLLDAYPRDDKVFTDPESIHKEGWHRILEVYLRQQSVRLDVDRFRPLTRRFDVITEKSRQGVELLLLACVDQASQCCHAKQVHNKRTATRAAE
ncbi:hypothetical protein ZIOFF_071723 [Zingiber officinale]|uniref:Uncharacterized protein n=1 Tax=Zingiber officinale TaxID=94328 RepID=A0A8J5CUW5_ZINOF|nr:hypothetical protein ZIOFF_071723 [Zingiber officinale]